MATVDEIWDAVQTIRTGVQQIRSHLQDLMDPAKGIKIWEDCPKCHGTGVVLAYATFDGIAQEDVVLPPDINPATMTCPRCQGAKRFLFGWQDTNPTELP